MPNRWLQCILVVPLALALAGCGLFWPSTPLRWSQNLALVRNGGECSVPEMCDGNMDTAGSIGIVGVATRTGRVTHNIHLFETEFHTSGQVMLRFLKMQPIDRVVIHCGDLGYYKVFYRDCEREWQELLSDRHDGKTPIVIDTDIEASALVFDARPAAHDTRGRRKGRTPRPGAAQLRLNSAAQISEIEVYAKVR